MIMAIISLLQKRYCMAWRTHKPSKWYSKCGWKIETPCFVSENDNCACRGRDYRTKLMNASFL